MLNLQQYLRKGKLPEMDALKIFYEIILVVESLHKVSSKMPSFSTLFRIHDFRIASTEKYHSP